MLKYIIFGILFFGLLVNATPIDQRHRLKDGGFNRIVNGTDADIADFPYMVSLRWVGSHLCGGTLIHANWVLSAAHCVYGFEYPEYYSVQYSSTDLEYETVYASDVSQIIVHEGYDDWELMNDITILRTTRSIYLSQYASLLGQFMDSMPGSDATVIGWGYEMTGGEIQTTLQKVDIKIFSDYECSNRHLYEVFPSNICAGVEGGGQGQCSGDSGGPLLVYGFQVGIVSWSMKPCTIPPYPGVFTQVSYYREWIRQRSGV